MTRTERRHTTGRTVECRNVRLSRIVYYGTFTNKVAEYTKKVAEYTKKVVRGAPG